MAAAQSANDFRTPVLRTERLLLRAHTTEDLEGCAALWSDRTVVRYTIGKPASSQQSWSRILSYRGHWELMKMGYWAIEHKASRSYIGDVGLAHFKREGQPLIAGIPEIGWALMPRAQGQGFAIEASTAAVAWADLNVDSRLTACIIHRENHPSLRVAAKLGYLTVLRAATEEVPEMILARPAANRPRSADPKP